MREDAVRFERRPEEMPVLFDPVFEIGWREKHCRDHITPREHRHTINR
jgi:hypothetical protein